MAENVGSMTVEYGVIVDQAIKNLDRYNKTIEKNIATIEKQARNEKKQKEKQAKIQQTYNAKFAASMKKMKKQVRDVAVGVGLISAAFYGLLKASSYGSMYLQQFGATTQQLADHIMEETGINKALEDFGREFQILVDKIDDGDDAITTILESLEKFKKWFSEQTGFMQFLTVIGIITAAVLFLIGVLSAIGFAGIGVSAGFGIIKTAAVGITAALGGSTIAALLFAVAIGFILMKIFEWLLQETPLGVWFENLFKRFHEWDSWIHDILIVIATPLLLLLSAIHDVTHGNFGFPMLRKTMGMVGKNFESLRDRILRALNPVIDKINEVINTMKTLLGFLGISVGVKPLKRYAPTSGFGGSWDDTPSDSSSWDGGMPGGFSQTEIANAQAQYMKSTAGGIDMSSLFMDSGFDIELAASAYSEMERAIANGLNSSDSLAQLSPFMGDFSMEVDSSVFDQMETAIAKKFDLSGLIDPTMNEQGEYVAPMISNRQLAEMATSISPSSMPGGGDYNDVVIAPGGKVITTHPKDFLIATKTPSELNNNSTPSGDTYNIAPVINITSQSGSNSDMSRQISKLIATEIKRIVKV